MERHIRSRGLKGNENIALVRRRRQCGHLRGIQHAISTRFMAKTSTDVDRCANFDEPKSNPKLVVRS